MLLRYRFRLYPTMPQRVSLARAFGSARVVFNDAVAARKHAHAEGLPYPTMAVLSKQLITEAKRTPGRSWLGEVSAVVLQQALSDCDRAWKNFFASVKGERAGTRVGPPRFKRRNGTQSIRFTRNARFAVLGNGRLRLPKIGEVKVAWSRALPSEPSSVAVIKCPTGKYYASFVVAVDEGADFLEPLGDPEAETGIDLGLKDFAVLRGGRVIESPRFFRRLERRLGKAQRVLARKAQGSVNRAKARLRVAKIHEKIRDTRSDWVDKQVKAIVRENQAVYVEDLNVKGLSRGRAAKSVHDAAFGMFLARLESKAARSGRTFVKIDRFFPSTRLCSVCGVLAGPSGLEGLKVRSWACGCGAVHDRDVNAEVNTRREGSRIVAGGHPDTRNASGGDVRPGTPGRLRNPREGKNEEPARGGAVSTVPKPGVSVL
ncbi:RNA-guided endonuclease InsQ/TnpB family protein [Glycomyces dulcitolivorans]|uniref:RNA-guided endonuclease InsQ/TnpB family protein n=1 Tax=Glycomyces dulcitolivorans TaxID=2200759 RepID=UPI000DD40AF1|nr:RNA-guided endonuclease TnpB family protein [Glycomyces dulcitolivorans]